TVAMSRKLPPYASSGSTTWSPGRSTVRSRVSSAASPEANASPCAPPSSAARHSSSAVRVGLAERLYSYPPRSPPTPSCLYVEVWWIGTTTDPVLGSGSCPAWIASVSNPYRSSMAGEATPLTDIRTPAGEQLGVPAAGGHQLVVTALLDQPSLVQDVDPVDVPDVREPVADQHGGPVAAARAQLPEQRMFGPGVQGRRRL